MTHTKDIEDSRISRSVLKAGRRTIVGDKKNKHIMYDKTSIAMTWVAAWLVKLFIIPLLVWPLCNNLVIPHIAEALSIPIDTHALGYWFYFWTLFTVHVARMTIKGAVPQKKNKEKPDDTDYERIQRILPKKGLPIVIGLMILPVTMLAQDIAPSERYCYVVESQSGKVSIIPGAEISSSFWNDSVRTDGIRSVAEARERLARYGFETRSIRTIPCGREILMVRKKETVPSSEWIAETIAIGRIIDSLYNVPYIRN